MPQPMSPCNLRRSTIENLATEAREKCGLGFDAKIADYMAYFGGKVRIANIFDLADEIYPLITVRGKNDFDINLTSDTNNPPNRYNAQWALGHYILHYLYNKETGIKTCIRFGKDRIHWEAAWFAAGFSMPEKEFLTKYHEYDGDIERLKAYFYVNTAQCKSRIKYFTKTGKITPLTPAT